MFHTGHNNTYGCLQLNSQATSVSLAAVLKRNIRRGYCWLAHSEGQTQLYAQSLQRPKGIITLS